LVQEPQKTPEIKLETLQAVSFEIITQLTLLWRSLESVSSRGKGRKFKYGFTLHQLIIDAMRFHPDLRRLAELHRVAEEVEQELAVARKIHPILARTENPNSNTGS
jgi:hypothetical protein